MKNQPPDDRFDEKAKKVVSKGGFLADVGEDDIAIDFDTDVIKQFLHSEIDLALENAEQAVKERKNPHERSSDTEKLSIAFVYGFNCGIAEAADIIRKLKSK